MKKYKHKATGVIAEENNYFMCYTIKHERLAESLIDREIIENSNDWEEVKEEPNYLITAFKNIVSGCIFKHDTQLKDSYCLFDGKKPFYYKDELLENQQAIIYSVKNSKGEEFTIGDKFMPMGGQCQRVIKSFYIVTDHIHITTECGLDYFLSKVLKSPQNIYTTTDGIDVYEGDRVIFYVINKDMTPALRDRVTIGEFSNDDKVVAERYLTFLTKENRDKYIKENTKKPIFVSVDNIEYYFDNGPSVLYSVYPKDDWIEKQCNVKQAIEFKNWKHFGKYTARQEYIDKNKPKYSFLDILNAYNNTCSWATFMNELKKLGK